jgi:hypothetical protein
LAGISAIRASVVRQLAVEELHYEVLDRGFELGAADPQPAVQTFFDADVNLPLGTLLWHLFLAAWVGPDSDVT